MPSVLVLLILPLVARSSNSQGYPGPYSTQTKQTWDYSGPCGPGAVFYPEADGNFPLLGFAHGLDGQNVLSTYSYTLNSLASWGYIVVAHEGCPSDNQEYKTQEAMMDWAFSHWTTIDHSKPSGIFGHSMGGGSTMVFAGDGNACVKHAVQGAFMMHPCDFQNPHSSPTWVPTLYTSGSSDTLCTPTFVYGEYKKGGFANGKPVGYGVYKGASHLLPCGVQYNPEAIDIANWFGCYVYQNQDSCSSIYNGFCSNKIATGQTYGCELSMNGEAATSNVSASFTDMWSKALDSGDPLQALAVPWGRHNGTWAAFMDEIKTRGDWAVQQRTKYLRSRGLYPTVANSSESTLMV